MGNLGEYHDYQEDIDRQKIRYGRSYTDFDKTVDYFNISRLPDYSNAAEPYLAYIFMSRPMLNIAVSGWVGDDNSSANLSALKSNAMTAAFTNDAYGSKLLQSLSAGARNAWLPIITTKAMSYSVGDIELKTVEKGNTYFGHVLKYGKHSEDHKISSTVTIDFRNDRYLSILKLMYLWMTYIHQVSKNDSIQPQLLFQRNAILDYAASIYYLVTRRDGREIVYWEKLVGVFPIKIPMSIFSSNDTMILEDKVSIDFSYGIKADPCDPSILFDINMLSGDAYTTVGNKMSGLSSLSNEVYPTGSRMQEVPFAMGDQFALNPYIKVSRSYTGNLKYYLCWEGSGTN